MTYGLSVMRAVSVWVATALPMVMPAKAASVFAPVILALAIVPDSVRVCRALMLMLSLSEAVPSLVVTVMVPPALSGDV